MAHIMVVDDEAKIRVALSVILEDEGYRVSEAESAEEALLFLESCSDVDIVITDNRMSGMEGLELLKHITIEYPHIDTIVMTAFGSANIGAQAFQNGALEFLAKPFEMSDLLTHIRSSLKKKELLKLTMVSQKRVDMVHAFDTIIGESRAILEAQKLCRMAAPRDTTIIIRGPSGSGKELIARAIHQESGRDPFIAINCGAIPENLLESELFGHEKGAFTNAYTTKEGCFERVGCGTLFLDEIGDIPLPMQVKLLRVLQEKEFLRVGGVKAIPFYGRIITATHRDLEAMITENLFREDLYFRLNRFPIEVPPLSKRVEDIPLLTAFFLQKHRHPAGISPNALLKIREHSWLGNVRELENSIERALILAEGQEISEEHLFFLKTTASQKREIASPKSQSVPSLLDTEKAMINDALIKAGGNKSKAARILGITRRVLYSKLKLHNL